MQSQGTLEIQNLLKGHQWYLMNLTPNRYSQHLWKITVTRSFIENWQQLLLLLDYCFSFKQQPTPNNWWRKANMCAKSSMYGVGVCVDYDIRRQYFNNEYPLYSIMGFTHAAIRVVPGIHSKFSAPYAQMTFMSCFFTHMRHMRLLLLNVFFTHITNKKACVRL